MQSRLMRLVKHFQRDYAKKRPNMFWDTPHGFRDCQEVLVCEMLAKSLRAQGKDNIRKIRKHGKDFPDCLAEMDGKEIGIEVTELKEDKEPYKEWTLEQFQKHILSIVRCKNEKAQIQGREELLESLYQLYIVIMTDEFMLFPETIRDYLRQPLGPKPCKIDKVFFLGPYEPADKAVIREQIYEPVKARVEFTVFQVLWTDKGG